MIDVLPEAPGCPRVRIVLRPPRALSGRQVGALFAVLSGTMWVVALLGAVFGNVYAPAFAFVHTLIVALALRWMWRLSERCERIDVDGTAVRVRRQDGPVDAGRAECDPVFEAPACWVRLSLGPVGCEPHVLLDAHARHVEVGGFLAPDERRALADRLRDALREASGRSSTATADVGYQNR